MGLPTVSYSSDEGLSFGLLGTLFYHAEGGYNPYHSTIEAWGSLSTEGSQKAAVFFDSPFLLGAGQRLAGEIRYERFDPMFYYGIGNDSDYDEAVTDVSSPAFIAEDYYSFGRRRLTAWMTYQRRWGAFKLLGGLGLTHTGIDLFDGTTVLGGDDVAGKDGGFTNYVKVGIIHDTRDFEPAPSRGDWTDLLLEVSHGVLGSDYNYVRLTFTNRHYFTLAKNLVLAERVVVEKGWGNMPFYEMAFFNSSYKVEEGLGGAKTIRGQLKNRFLGPSKCFANLELRWRFWDLQVFGQHFYVALSGFLDVGRVWRADAAFALTNLHAGRGGGLHVGWNETFIVSADVGTSNEVRKALYLTIGYLY